MVKAFRAIDHGRHNPTGDEYVNDREAEIRQVVIQTTNDAPEITMAQGVQR